MKNLIEKKFWEIKPEIRTVGIDDGPFKRGEKKTLLVGAVLRGGLWLDGVLSSEIEVDGFDATERIVEMINQSRHRGQLRAILVDGVTFAGFNVIDIREIFKQTGLPVIVVSRKLPDFKQIKQALKHLPDWRRRWSRIQAAGEIHEFKPKPRGATLRVQLAGIKRGDAEQIVRMTATRSSVPEPLRVAHLIATGITRGESVGGI